MVGINGSTIHLYGQTSYTLPVGKGSRAARGLWGGEAVPRGVLLDPSALGSGVIGQPPRAASGQGAALPVCEGGSGARSPTR
jgi:hypothetical protein